MINASVYLLPQGNSLHSGPAIYDYIKETYTTKLDLPAHALQKGVVLALDLGDTTFPIVIEELQYVVGKKQTILICHYCSVFFEDMSVFKRKKHTLQFEMLSQSLFAAGWTIHHE